MREELELSYFGLLNLDILILVYPRLQSRAPQSDGLDESRAGGPAGQAALADGGETELVELLQQRPGAAG